jgi:cell division septum initiation protein DivIVA
MSNQISTSRADAAAAMDEVLVAETAARQAMEACRREAEDILEAAREDVRRINRLANERGSRLHARCNELVSARVAGIRAAARQDAVRTELNAADHELLATAAARLAARLTRPENG